MRTTLTLDPDVAAMLREAVAHRGVSFKQVVNEAIRAGLGGRRTETFAMKTYSLGEPAIPLTHALRLAAELEDEDIVSRLSLGK